MRDHSVIIKTRQMIKLKPRTQFGQNPYGKSTKKTKDLEYPHRSRC